MQNSECDVATPWVFRQLALRATSAEEEGNSIRLNIPRTMIFNDDGHHHLLITAQDGRLRVQGSSATPPNGHPPEDPDGRMRSAVGFMRQLNQSDDPSCVVRLVSAGCLGCIRQRTRTQIINVNWFMWMDTFKPRYSSIKYRTDRPLFSWPQARVSWLTTSCSSFSQVWYADNEHEVMDARLGLKLVASISWRQQLVALQGHVVPQRVEYGVYRASEDVCDGVQIDS